jgi:hypothetical protein
MQAMLRTLLI